MILLTIPLAALFAILRKVVNIFERKENVAEEYLLVRKRHSQYPDK